MDVVDASMILLTAYQELNTRQEILKGIITYQESVGMFLDQTSAEKENASLL